MSESENCRYCNTPLEKGYIAGNKVLWWTKEEPGFMLKNEGDNIQLDKSSTSWAKIPAKLCRTCRTIIAEYDK